MEEIDTILPANLAERAAEVTGEQTRQSLSQMVAKVIQIRQSDRLKDIEATELTQPVIKTLAKVNEILDSCDAPPAILSEFVECLTVGAQITQDINLSIDLANTSLKICSQVKLANLSNVVETLLTTLVSNFTQKISEGSIIAFGKVTVPVWISNQSEHLEQLIRLCDTEHKAGPALS